MIETARRCRPLGSKYLIRLLKVPERTLAGIWLPDSALQQWTDGEVVAAGPGMATGIGRRSVMQAEVGDRVLFRKHSNAILDSQDRLTSVSDEDLLAILDAAADPWPKNDWILLEFLDRIEQKGGIHLTERKSQRPHCGRILRYGPGRLRTTGYLAGTRRTCQEIMGLERGRDLTGLLVHFSRQARTLDVYPASGRVCKWLIPAEDLLCYEESQEL